MLNHIFISVRCCITIENGVVHVLSNRELRLDCLRG